MGRIWVLVLAAVCVFAVVTLILLRLMHAPLKDADYLVIGSVATLLSLLAVFVVLVITGKSNATTGKQVFFKRRKKIE